MKTRETTEEVSSHGVEKRVERRKSERSAPFTREYRGRIGKKIGKKSCKLVGQEENHEKAHAGRGQKSKWEMSVKISSMNKLVMILIATIAFVKSVNAVENDFTVLIVGR